MHKKLFIPGPTEVREEVLKAQTNWMIGHRTKDFGELYHRCVTKTHESFLARDPVLPEASFDPHCVGSGSAEFGSLPAGLRKSRLSSRDPSRGGGDLHQPLSKSSVPKLRPHHDKGARDLASPPADQ